MLSFTLAYCSPLRSCPERPGPQVVLCLGMRSEVRNGVCLCSSRYARSSRWAELVAVCLCVWGRGETERNVLRVRGRKKKKQYCQHTCAFRDYNNQTTQTQAHTHLRWQRFMSLSWGSCQASALPLADSYRKEKASPTWLCPKIPSSLCLSRGTETDAIRPLSGLISSVDKCLIHGVNTVWRWLLIVHTTLCLQGQHSEPLNVKWD